jgi:hypothetical protein
MSLLLAKADMIGHNSDVHFSNRPVGVKRFQAPHRYGVDVAHGLALLSGIGAAWARLLRHLTIVPTRVFLLARWIREAVDVLLPVAYVGGGLIGARILTFWRMPSVIALASAAADLFLQIIAQVLFAAFGAALLMRLVGARNVLPDAIVGLSAAVIALGGFYIVQRHGGARILDRLLLLGLPGLLVWHTVETHSLFLSNRRWNSAKH